MLDCQNEKVEKLEKVKPYVKSLNLWSVIRSNSTQQESR